MNIDRIVVERMSRLPRSFKALIAIVTLWSDLALTACGHPAWALLIGIVGATVFFTAVPRDFRMRSEMANGLRNR